MRSVWWLVVALCLVAGGVRERDRSQRGSYELYAPLVHAAKPARRHQPAPGLPPFVAAHGYDVAPPLVAVAIQPARGAADALSLAPIFVRSSRGPPQS